MKPKTVLVFADNYDQVSAYVAKKGDRHARKYRYIHSPDQLEGIEPGTCEYVYLGERPGRNVINSPTYKALMVKEDFYWDEHQGRG